MQTDYTGNLITILSFLVGAFITIMVQYFQQKGDTKRQHLERIDKYKLVALEKRLEVSQISFTLWFELRSVIHEQNPITRDAIVQKAFKFWKENCLYLNNRSRDLFNKVIFEVSQYDILNAAVRNTTGTERTEARQNLRHAWELIMSFPQVLAAEMDLEIPEIRNQDSSPVGANV